MPVEFPTFSEMADAEFDAWWENAIETAAQAAVMTGDDAAVEALMLAHGDAYGERFPF